MASAGAIFLMMELHYPFDGFIEIPSTTLCNALAPSGLIGSVPKHSCEVSILLESNSADSDSCQL